MSQVIMQLVFLGLAMFFIYLIYCIIHTHMLTQENQEILLKLLAIEKQKQKEDKITMLPDHPSTPVQDIPVSENTDDIGQEVSVFDHMDHQSF